jgi:cytochrome c biogenesis protein CcmG, thiol:disulfide interchange protein DsbE
MRRVFVLLCGLTLAACGAATPVGPSPAGPATIAVDSQILGDAGQSVIPEVGEVAPDFAYTTADGATHKLSELHGKKVLLNFWATWCGPCRFEMPDIQKAIGESGGAVVAIGVNKAEEMKQIVAFADELKVTFPLITNQKGDIAARYAAQLLPTSYFINSDGTIALRKTGVMNYSFIKNHLAQLK